jgi:hypothetical protein
MTAENPPKGIDLDEPLADGEVIVARGLANGTVYHTDRDCHSVKQMSRGRRTSREGLYPIYDECVYCAGERDSEDVAGVSNISECPRCGGDVTKLGVHLRHCDGVVDRA